MAVVTSTRNFIRMLSGTFAVAVSSTIISNTLSSAVSRQSLSPSLSKRILDDPTVMSHPSTPLTPEQRTALIEGYTLGFRVCFYLASGFCVVALLSTLFIVQHQELTREGEKEAREEGKQWVARRKGKKGRGVFESRKGEEEEQVGAVGAVGGSRRSSATVGV